MTVSAELTFSISVGYIDAAKVALALSVSTMDGAHKKGDPQVA